MVNPNLLVMTKCSTHLCPKMLKFLLNVPVYPKEILGYEIKEKFGLQGLGGLPASAPICQEDDRFSYPDKQSKEEYVAFLKRQYPEQIKTII